MTSLTAHLSCNPCAYNAEGYHAPPHIFGARNAYGKVFLHAIKTLCIEFTDIDDAAGFNASDFYPLGIRPVMNGA